MDGPFEAQPRLLFALNNPQILNYMHRIIDSNIDFMHYSKFVFLKNFLIALKKSGSIIQYMCNMFIIVTL